MNLPPRGNINSAIAQRRVQEKTVNASLEAFVNNGELRTILATGHTPGTPSTNGIYMRDGSYKTFLKYGMKYGNTSPLR